MESRWGARVRALVGCGAAVTLIAPAAFADENVESELQAMRDMVLQLQDQLQNQQQQIESQQERIDAAGLDEDSAASRLSSFLEGTDFSGTIAFSYFYNSNQGLPGSQGNAGANFQGGIWGSPFHPDTNTFNVDELWISASREATEESPVGFGFDVVFGQLGDIIESGSQGLAIGNNNGLWLNQAYIDWLTPFGITITAGKFGTHIGYEVAGAAYNATITRGLTYQQFQPVSQIGVKASTDIGPIGVMVGLVNSLSPNSPDSDDFKDLIWALSWGNDLVSLNFAGEWGNDAGFYGQSSAAAFGGNQEALTLDWIAEITPNDSVVAWLNLTYARLLRDEDPQGLGLNVGTRVAVTDKLGLTGRFEYGRGFNEPSGTGAASDGAVFDPTGTGIADVDGISITTTVDYLLAEGLTIKSEFRWDKVLDADINGVAGELSDLQKVFDAGTEDDEFLWGAQLVYTF